MKESQLIMYFGPMSVFLLTLFFALVNTGLFFVAHKHGLVEYYEIHRKRWMPRKCEFCAFFWMCTTELVLWYTFFRAGAFDICALGFMVLLGIAGAVLSVFFANYRDAIR